MGGQDGWLGSDAFFDQVDLWKDGRLIAVPFSPRGVAAGFPHVQHLTPSALN